MKSTVARVMTVLALLGVSVSAAADSACPCGASCPCGSSCPCGK